MSTIVVNFDAVKKIMQFDSQDDINTGKRNEKYVICPVCRSFNRHEDDNIVKPEERCSE